MRLREEVNPQCTNDLQNRVETGLADIGGLRGFVSTYQQENQPLLLAGEIDSIASRNIDT